MQTVMVVIRAQKDQKQNLRAAKKNRPLLEIPNINVQIIERDRDHVARQGVIIVLYHTDETVTGGDQDLVAEKEKDVGDLDQIVETEVDVGGQDQVVKKDVDEHQDPVVQIEEVVTVPRQDSTEDHLQEEGLKIAHNKH